LSLLNYLKKNIKVEWRIQGANFYLFFSVFSLAVNPFPLTHPSDPVSGSNVRSPSIKRGRGHWTKPSDFESNYSYYLKYSCHLNWTEFDKWQECTIRTLALEKVTIMQNGRHIFVHPHRWYCFISLMSKYWRMLLCGTWMLIFVFYHLISNACGFFLNKSMTWTSLLLSTSNNCSNFSFLFLLIPKL